MVGKRGATVRQIETLYRTRFDRFVRVAAAICGGADGGHDAVQSAFIAALRNRRRFRGDGPLEAWVWRIVVNEARRMKSEPAPAARASADTSATNGHSDDEDDPLGLRGWIAALPERQREAVFLRYYADLDYRAIADVLDVEVGTVSATLGAAHRTLRKRLEVRR